ADIPRGVAAVRNAVRIRRCTAGNGAGLGAVEVIARAEVPVAGLAGKKEAPALRHSSAGRREFRAAHHIGALGTGIEHGRRVVHGATERELVIDGVVALRVRLPETQVLLDDVAVDRQAKTPSCICETVCAEDRVEAAIEALPARIPIVPSAEI